MNTRQPHNSDFINLGSISMLFSFLFLMLASNVLLNLPLIGGALYLLSRVATIYGRWMHPLTFKNLTKSQKTWAYILLSLTFVIALLLMIALPISIFSTRFWVLGALVFLMTVRPFFTQHRLDKDINKGAKPVKMLWHLVFSQLILLVPLVLVLFFSVDTNTSWSLLFGYLICTLFDVYAIWKNRYYQATEYNLEEEKESLQALQNVHAFKTFLNLLMVTTAALHVTLIMAYTFIGCTANELLVLMGIASLGMVLAYVLSSYIFNRTFFKKSPDPINVLIFGFTLWFLGILLFSNNILTSSILNAYLSLGLCSLGVGIVVRVLKQMEYTMHSVVLFALKKEPGPSYDQALSFRMEFAALLGQMLALLGIALIFLFSPTTSVNHQTLIEGIRPLLALPALLLVFSALVCALLFPMTKQHIDKLNRLMELNKNGEKNLPLRQQLEAVVIRRSLKHYGIKILLALFRPFYYHRIVGRENVPAEKDVPTVFVCNHGEIYGPIVTNLYVPFSFRPWVINNMIDKEDFARTTAEGAFSHVKWLNEHQRLALAKFVAPLVVWIMRSVDCIPVYYNNPRQLMNSFRESVSAMQAGDNILLFPENSDDTPDHRYKLSGVSHFYTGFTMLGQLYYSKTHVACNFVPIYANKQKRTLTFGVPTKYDPTLPANDEKDRLCTYLRGEMLRIAGEEDTFPQQTASI